MTPRTIGELCAELHAEPLLYLSLHSKELFHSNLLAWLCETHPDVASEVFARWVPADGDATRLRVQREWLHLDLAVELPGLAPFIVENKVFAPPDEDQLDRIAALAGAADRTLLLLSLSSPLWTGDTYRSRPSGPVWRYVSYADLADGLEAVRGRIVGFDGDLVEHYCYLIRSLHRLAAMAGQVGPDDPISVDPAAGEQLRSVRLHDGIGKLRARLTMEMARTHTTPLLPAAKIRWEASFTRGHPLVAAFLDRGDGYQLGWQYQGDQWRVVVITSTNTGTDATSRARRHADVAERFADWFDFRAITTLTGRTVDVVPPTEAGGGFNGYNPNFVYRYRRIAQLTSAELVRLSDHYLTSAANLA